MAIAAATGAAVFPASAEQALKERPDAVPVWTARPRTRPERFAMCPTRPCHHVEQALFEPEAGLRATGARMRGALEAALGPALAAVTARDARG